jgi:hypothetical protein
LARVTSTPSVMLRLVPVAIGLLGMAGAIVLGLMLGRVEWWHFAMGGLGILSAFGGLLWQQDTSWRDTLSSIAYSFFAMVCFLFVYLISANRTWVTDLTRDGVFTLSPQSRAMLRDLPQGQQLEVISILPRAEHDEQRKFFALYRAAAPSIKFEVYDLDTDIVQIRAIDSKPLTDDLIVILKRDGQEVRRRKFKLGVTGSSRERVLSNAIAEISLGRDKHIYMTRDHGERQLIVGDDASKEEKGGAILRSGEMIAERAFRVGEVRLIDGIPEDTAVIIMPGPTRDISEYERDVLLEYLRGGGRVMLWLDPQPTDDNAMPNLDAILAAAGLESPNQFILDPTGSAATSSRFAPRVRPEGKHPIVGGVTEAPFFMFTARQFIPSAEQTPNARPEVLLASSERSWAQSPAEISQNRSFREPDDPSRIGAMVLGVASRIIGRDGTREVEGRLVAFGDSDTFTDAMLTGESAAMLLQSVNWLTGRESMLNIPPRIVEASPLVLSNAHVFAMVGTFLLIGLAVGLGGCGFAIARRKRR